MRILFVTLFLGIITSCNNQSANSTSVTTDSVENVVDTNVVGVIEYIEPTFDFGTVKEGEVVEHVFKFKNTGNAPVILVQVTASCGCTTPDYSKDPILPGNEGEIKVSFDSKGQIGQHEKIISIRSNAQNEVTTVRLKGTVEQ